MYTTIKRKHKNQEMIGIEEGIIIKVSLFNGMRQLQGQYFRFFIYSQVIIREEREN